ncbi:uncharacterized protein LOC132746344, partial [Ruditapes philippinarum]|uniref:uncharacterized protein LOC132746344 n=1 Tax=Ruditapes philippinarum TaxID=129788 RepID=UPI00295BED14
CSENRSQVKKTLENMYIVTIYDKKTITVIKERLSQIGASYVLKQHLNEKTGKYIMICYKQRANSFNQAIKDLKQFDLDIKPANLVWDTDSIKIEGLPNANRYVVNNQLIYSIRSVEKYAPWIRHIYIVTNDQTPSWLNTSYERIAVISTKEIFPNPKYLPTFSSPAIESYMYRIPGLSETFLFMCDDFIFGQPVTLRDFYTSEEGYKIKWDAALPPCWFRCFNTLLGNGKCDRSCDNIRCGWDHGDCRKITRAHIKQMYPLFYGGNFKGSIYNTIAMFNRHRLNNDGVVHFNFPPHRPLLVNRQIASDLYKTFHEEFKISSSIHFRSQFNVQYTMAYLLYITTTHVTLTPANVFDELDKNKTGQV